MYVCAWVGGFPSFRVEETERIFTKFGTKPNVIQTNTGTVLFNIHHL
jgi:hypothetical protein